MYLSDLTPRQREVARLLDRGLTRPQIAAQLSRPGKKPMSVRTVDVHLHAIAARLPDDDLPASRRDRKWMREVAAESASQRV